MPHDSAEDLNFETALLLVIQDLIEHRRPGPQLAVMASDAMDLDPTSPASTSANIASQKRSPSSPPPLGFQFVNISEPTEIHGPQNQKLIRSLVAQNHRRKQLLKHSEGSSDSCIDPDVASMFPVLNFCPVCGFQLARKRTLSKSLEPSSTFTAPVTRPNDPTCLGAGRVDPFGIFPISVQPYMHILVDHYVTNYCPTFQPYGKWDVTTSPIITRLFRGFALQQPVYFHATLCIAATHLNVSSGQSAFQAVAGYHRGEAIKLLNAMLQDTTDGITDLMIAVVGSLANHDIMVGDRTALFSHRNGMVEMIRRRGGIHHHSLMCLLRYRAFWIDFMSAVFNHTMPLFPDDAQYTPSRPIEHVSIDTTGFHSLVTSSNLSSPVTEMIEELLSLTREVHRLRGVRSTPDEMKSTTSRRARVERALYTYSFQNPTTEKEIQHCIRLTALIYTNCVFRQTPDASAIFSTFTRQLQQALEQTNILSLWDDHTEALLWVLFLGGIVVPTSDTDAKAWYTSWLILVCHHLEICTWEACLVVMRKYLWSEQDLERKCKSLWCEVVVNLRFT